jgi:hypothetical protein
MIKDPIVEEVRKVRDEYAQRFNYDLDAICCDLQQRQAQSTRKVVSFPPKPVSIAAIETPNKRMEPTS